MNARMKFRRWLGPDPEGKLLALFAIPAFVLFLIFGGLPVWGPWIAGGLLSALVFLAVFSVYRERRRDGPPREVRTLRTLFRVRPWVAAIQLLLFAVWLVWLGLTLVFWANGSEPIADRPWFVSVLGLIVAMWVVDWLYDQRNIRRGLDAKADLASS